MKLLLWPLRVARAIELRRRGAERHGDWAAADDIGPVDQVGALLQHTDEGDLSVGTDDADGRLDQAREGTQADAASAEAAQVVDQPASAVEASERVPLYIHAATTVFIDGPDGVDARGIGNHDVEVTIAVAFANGGLAQHPIGRRIEHMVQRS